MGNKMKANNKKTLILLLIILGAATLLFVTFLIYGWLFGDEDPVNPDNPVVTATPIPPNNLDVPPIKNVTVEDSNKVIYDNGDIKLVMEPATNKNLTVGGNTRDGKEWKKDGDAIVVDNKKITVEKNTKNVDNGKIAAVASALNSKKGYTEGVDDYNHNYAIYYMEAAHCMLYYPKQLTLVKEGEDQSLLFRDSRSNAELKVTLDENEYASMDELESLIANSAYSTVLASGTDWFTAETYGKSTTIFSLTGLGNKYAVEAELTYEKKYGFVFEELRKLIKCQFIGEGVWVSNAKADTVGKKVPAVAKSASAYDPVLKRTSYYSKKLNCVVAYPDIFTKQYENNDSIFFTDPVTGAYIEVTKAPTDITIGELQARLAVEESNLVSDHSLRASNGNELMFATIRDGYIWTAFMSFEGEYKGIYSYAYEMLEICIEGDDADTTEMKQIYFPAFNCYVVLPMQYEEYGTDGDVHLIRDSITGMEARLSFTAITNPADYDNLYNVFNVVAEDGNVLLCEDMVKWHNINGLFLGAAGREYAALLELTYPNAYTVYKSCWKDFGICFFTGEELETDAEEIREEAMAATVLEVAKEEVIAENDTAKEVFAKADAPADKKESNVSETLKENGKKQGASNIAVPTSKIEPNSVLVYKTENDYLDVTTSGDEWVNIFPEVFPRPVDTKKARYYVVLYSMNVLAYNGYTIPDYASDVNDVAEVVDDYVRALMSCGERIDTQLGEGVVSVFEVLCYYLGIDEVPQYVIKDLNNSENSGNKTTPTPTKRPDATVTPTSAPTSATADPHDAKKTFAQLPFSDISGLDEEGSIYGSLTELNFALDRAAYLLLENAIAELSTLNFSCNYKEVSEWGEDYQFTGYLPGTDVEMLIYISMQSDFASVLWMIEDEDFFDEPGTLSFYGIDYNFDTLNELHYVLRYMLESVYDFEAAYGVAVQYRFTQAEYDMTKAPFVDWAQDIDWGNDHRTCNVIESGYYGADGEFIALRTYVYLSAEGYTICFDEKGYRILY